MSLIDKGSVVDGDPLPRFLYGDDKIRASMREARRMIERCEELLTAIHTARFRTDPPDHAAAHSAALEIVELGKELKAVGEDLRLHTEAVPQSP